MLDLLIRNGLVIDGSGNPGYYASVGVKGDAVRILRGDTSALPATRIRQGLITELIGIDGNSHAPFKTQEDRQRYIDLDSGLNGEPPMQLARADLGGRLGRSPRDARRTQR